MVLFMILLVITTLACVAAGLSMIPWQCRTFSEMSHQEQSRYIRGIALAAIPSLLFLFVMCVIVI